MACAHTNIHIRTLTRKLIKHRSERGVAFAADMLSFFGTMRIALSRFVVAVLSFYIILPYRIIIIIIMHVHVRLRHEFHSSKSVWVSHQSPAAIHHATKPLHRRQWRDDHHTAGWLMNFPRTGGLFLHTPLQTSVHWLCEGRTIRTFAFIHMQRSA